MKYSAKDANSCIPAGTYDASIKKVDDTKEDGSPLLSQKGEAMQKVTFEVYTDGANRTLSAYYTAKTTLWLYKRLATAIGQLESFKSETFDAKDHLGANLKLELEVETTEKYGDQNRIKTYLPSGGSAGKTTLTGSSPEGRLTEEDIPF